MKKLLKIMLCISFTLCLAGCGESEQDNTSETLNTTVTPIEQFTNEEDTANVDVIKENTEQQISDNEEIEGDASMKMYIGDMEIPVIWEDNASVSELMEEAEKGEITVAMSMHSTNEQVGSLGKSYISNDKQTTTHNGDIVLYNSSNIVVFYGSNSWAYTRLGKMDMAESEVIDLLSKGNVILRLVR